jgi:hypothetical protein
MMHYDNPKFFGGMDVFPVEAFVEAVKATKKAPSPVGGWHTLMVPQQMHGHPLLQEEASIHIAQGEKSPEVAEEALPHWMPRTAPASLPANAQVLPETNTLGSFVVLAGPVGY